MAFDPGAVADPPAPDGPAEVTARNRGLMLVRGFTQRMEYERTGGHDRLTVLLAG